MNYIINGRLIFQGTVNNTPVDFDPVTGEPIFEDATPEVVKISIEDVSNVNEILMASTDEQKIKLSGRCVEPKTLTPNQRRQKNVALEILNQDHIIKTRIELDTNIVGRLNLNSYFGDRICGMVATDNITVS
jgi:hypothetical protein